MGKKEKKKLKRLNKKKQNQEKQRLALKNNGVQSPIELTLLKALKKTLSERFKILLQERILNYFADFVIEDKMGLIQPLVIEADGAAYHTSEEHKRNDLIRENNIKTFGYDVVRFTGSEIQRNAM